MALRTQTKKKLMCALSSTFGVLLLTLCLLAIAAMCPESASTQFTCGDNICDPDESAQTCPQDCGILLLDEDFEDGQVQNFNYDPGQWEIITDADSLVWNNTQQAWATAGSNAWSDIALFFRMRRVNDNANIYFRTNWSNQYALQVEEARIVLWTERTGAYQELTNRSIALGTTWHDYSIDATGPQITVTIDSAVVLTYTDGISASLRGGIGLEPFGSNGVHFDDILLYSIVPQCYNDVQDGDETGIDCGGSCPIQDCCTNRAWDIDQRSIS